MPSYCRHPHVMPDTGEFPIARGIAINHDNEHPCCGDGHPRCEWVKPPNSEDSTYFRVEDMVGQADLARELRVRPQSITQWRVRHGSDHRFPFPEPVLKINSETTFVYSRTQILEWLKATGREGSKAS